MNFYIHKLIKKHRIIKLNKIKYYLIPIKAKEGFWAEHPFRVIDEMFSGKNYFIGGNYAKYYYGLIEQIPKEIDVYTTKRQGSIKIFNIEINFRRTTRKNLRKSIKKKIKNHHFSIIKKDEIKNERKS